MKVGKGLEARGGSEGISQTCIVPVSLFILLSELLGGYQKEGEREFTSACNNPA